MSTVRKLYKPIRWLRLHSILKCKHSFENQEVGRHLEAEHRIPEDGRVGKAISITWKQSSLGQKEKQGKPFHDL